jgi:hypothetical protein
VTSSIGPARIAAIYAALATGCSYSYAVIDGMTLTEAEEIFGYWADNPPVHVMLQVIARMLGWKPAEHATPSLTEIAAMAPPGVAMAVAGELGMPPPVLDIDTLRARNQARLAKNGKRL